MNYILALILIVGNQMNISDSENEENFEKCPPRPDALIHSIRAFGYSLPMAIADLIDNSITAGSSNIWIKYSWNQGDPWIVITDDGVGMSGDVLHEAMRLGSRSPLEERNSEDLGRFGLGLKTASFSQCKHFTVVTKTSKNEISTRFWDLDHVRKSMEWSLGKTPEENIWNILSDFSRIEHGTSVVWENLDRLTYPDTSSEDSESYFLTKFLDVKKYLEMVFHKYLDAKGGRIKIFVGVSQCESWDPYLTKNEFTSELAQESYEDSKVSVLPYILPHVSHRSEQENVVGAGIKGWNEQQGFYVYRNGRLIVPGGYLDLDLKPEEHYKLGRIKVDITNDLDHEWSIDVRKSIASPPDRIRGELLRIAKATRQKASEIYRARTGRPRLSRTQKHPQSVWLKKEINEKIVYRINRQNLVIIKILAEVSVPDKWVTELFKVIETTVPHSLIIMDGLEKEDCHVGLPASADPPSQGLTDICSELYMERRKEGRSHEEAAELVCSIEPFDLHPFYRAHLDKYAEGD